MERKDSTCFLFTSLQKQLWDDTAFCEVVFSFFAVSILLPLFGPTSPARPALYWWFSGRGADGRNAFQAYGAVSKVFPDTMAFIKAT